MTWRQQRTHYHLVPKEEEEEREASATEGTQWVEDRTSSPLEDVRWRET